MPKKEKYLVSLTRPDGNIKGLTVPGRGRRNFSKSGQSFTVSDGGEANEIRKEFGKDVIVSKIPNYKPPDEMGHRYSFSIRKVESETREEKQERMRQEGWVEFKPGQWKKVAQTIE